LIVAQICNLPYRRFSIGTVPSSATTIILEAPMQVENLRYGRLQICATTVGRMI